MKLNAITTNITFGTNILDIEVPEHLTRKFKTGLSFVDGAMGGQGFTPSSVTLSPVLLALVRQPSCSPSQMPLPSKVQLSSSTPQRKASIKQR